MLAWSKSDMLPLQQFGPWDSVQEAILAIEAEAAPPRTIRRPPLVAQGQVEAFPDLPAIHCLRCGRLLKHPQYLNGGPFGRDCIVKEGMGQ